MSLADRLEAARAAEEERQRLASMCSFGRVIETMSETERVAFGELAQRVRSLTELSRILRAEKYPHDEKYLREHLRGTCSCAK